MQHLLKVYHHQVPVQAHVRLPQGVLEQFREQQQREQVAGTEGHRREDESVSVLPEVLCESSEASLTRGQVPCSGAT